MSTPSEPAARASETNEAQRRRRVGLGVVLGGFGLVVLGLALPWETFTCTARCGPGSAPIAYVPLTDHAFPLLPWVFPIFALLPYSLLAVLAFVVAILKVALQERLPADRRSAVPALVLTGLLLAGTLYPLLSFAQGLHSPVDETALAPGGFVSVLGCLLVGLGGWLRYHPRRVESARRARRGPSRALRPVEQVGTRALQELQEMTDQVPERGRGRPSRAWVGATESCAAREPHERTWWQIMLSRSLVVPLPMPSDRC